MDYHLEEIELEAISKRLTIYSINTIEWSCLYSSLGIIKTLSNKEVKKIKNITKDYDKNKHLLKNLVMLKCIYKKGKPTFSTSPKEVINPGDYMWNHDKFDKTIEISTQAYAILSLVKASEIFYYSNKTKGKLLIWEAELILEFISTFMRNTDGFYISVENKTKNLKDSLKIKPLKSTNEIIDQVIVLEGLSYLYNITKGDIYTDYKSAKASLYLRDMKILLKYIYDNYDLLLGLDTKVLCLAISSLCNIFHIYEEEEDKASLKYLIAFLCAELESRKKITSELEKTPDKQGTASTLTYFIAITALLKGYEITEIYKFKALAFELFGFIKDIFDEIRCIFIKPSKTEISYSLREICDILVALKLLNNTKPSIEVSRLIKAFYNTSVENSGIVQSIPSFISSIDELRDTTLDFIPSMEETKKAPVFLKDFTINLKKLDYTELSDSFNSNYAMYSVYNFLTYFHYSSELTRSEKNFEIEETSSEEKDTINSITSNINEATETPLVSE